MDATCCTEISGGLRIIAPFYWNVDAMDHFWGKADVNKKNMEEQAEPEIAKVPNY